MSPAGERLPKITRPQLDRLVEIGLAERYAWAWDKPATTRKLRELGLVVTYGVRPGPNRVREAVCLTDAGRTVLAGLPGDEFDIFRDKMEAAYDRA